MISVKLWNVLRMVAILKLFKNIYLILNLCKKKDFRIFEQMIIVSFLISVCQIH
jgi:hypothetical protein